MCTCSSRHSAAPQGEPKEFGHTGLTDRLSDAPSDASQFVVLESTLEDTAQHHEHVLMVDSADPSDARARVLSTLSLLALCFFSICAGPVGSEAIITAGGPVIGLTALVVFPILFYVPMCFVITELVTAIPEAGGHAYWIALAFGPQWGFQAGYWSWVANCVNCAFVASMSVALFSQNSNNMHRSTLEEVFRQALPLVLALPGFLSLRHVGRLLSGLFVGVVSIYFVLAVSGAINAGEWGDLTDFRYANATGDTSEAPGIEVDVLSMVNSLIWSFHGFHNLSVFATEVQHPAVTYRRVLLLALVIVPLTYLLPITAAIAVSDPKWTEWRAGANGKFLIAFSGSPRDLVVGLMVVLNAVALYVSGLLSSAFLASGMVAKRFGPPGFASNSRSQTTPHSAIFASLPIMLIIVNIECNDMVRISNALSGLCIIVLILAAIRLRFTRRDLVRPTKLCGNAHVSVMILSLLVPIASFAYATAHAFETLISRTLTSVFVLIGLVYGWRGNFSNFDSSL